jgi:hypothetical protein
MEHIRNNPGFQRNGGFPRIRRGEMSISAYTLSIFAYANDTGIWAKTGLFDEIVRISSGLG